jgi:MoaA/NifB/PqqE/SkfB family radical SAM enzyme
MPDSKFPDTFLDYIPDPPMGREAYRKALERSFERDEAEVHPIYALLKVTNRCSSQCVYCGHAGVTDKTGEASTELLKDVLSQLAEVGTVSVNFTGGEPLQRADLPELVAHARASGLFPILLTNGLLLRKREGELRLSGLGMVIVSIDSVRPEAYRATRGVRLEPVLDGVEALLAWPEDERPAITVTIVVTSENVDHLDEVVTYFGKRGVGVKLCPYHHHGRWEDDGLSPKVPGVYLTAMDRLRTMKVDDLGVINSIAYLDNFVPFNFENRQLPTTYRCYCGYTTLYIDPFLNVRSCWSQGLPIAGSLRDRPLRDLLQSPDMKTMREKIRKLECERCWLLCTAEISLRFQQ